MGLKICLGRKPTFVDWRQDLKLRQAWLADGLVAAMTRGEWSWWVCDGDDGGLDGLDGAVHDISRPELAVTTHLTDEHSLSLIEPASLVFFVNVAQLTRHTRLIHVTPH